MSGATGRIAGVDVGGTFTDAVVLDDNGHPRLAKVPTTARDQSAALVDGLRRAAGGDGDLAAVAHGTTTATNAVLERAVARTVLVTTDGFRDLLVIGRQDRPSLYDLAVTRPAPLVPSDLVVTVQERVGADGTVVIPLTENEIARVVDAVRARAPDSVAVCLLFSFAAPDHEERLCAAIANRLDVPVTRSSALLPEFREYERASTCVLDAAVAPVMRRYLRRLEARLPTSDIAVMTSSGGVAHVADVAAAPVHTLLSGPAAGVVAAAAVARDEGFSDAVAFDMGGTSTDVCLIHGGQPEIATEGWIGGLPFATPAVAIHTVGAGGGSVAWLDAGGALRVGPQSAGADPGPACYGRGGTAPTVTDAHVVLGHLLDDQPLGSGVLRLDRKAAEDAIGGLTGFAGAAEAAEGVVAVVQATMLRALRKVTTERGVDPATLALVAYGGAGPLHATALARELGCAAVIIPPAPGVLSALGLLLAPPRREATRTVMATWCRDAEPPDLSTVWEELARQALEHVPGGTVERIADCRYAGQSHELRITAEADVAAAFDAAHDAAFGYALPDEPVEVVTVRAVAQSRARLERPPHEWDHGPPHAAADRVSIRLDAREESVPLLHRAALQHGGAVEGPAVIAQRDSTTLLLPGDHAAVSGGAGLVVRW
ncbi:MAG: hydantoinase/oxoprolinase family protein [Nitriliruptorales bacterium]|nr:hydantoinase/oxoprolinase family protein [Nitriliruptorales bacterium]